MSGEPLCNGAHGLTAVRAKGEIQPAVVALKWPEPPATDRFAPAPIPALLAWGKAKIETLMNR